ncbi:MULTISPECIES: GNAT family N-acetyltransferase [Streptomyces]|uniref:GNAT family N-acetyltransferase n=1 Tax=Streptomyces venezuelae TaxID=54571 RepID=A0A5P2AXE8_STRVZ|nr:GNAT family N-acetyltransferase [Streptomyces venezuelae]QES21591.1 GNAT family N-acetyltransferase [Streptomyces venezuelae]
MTLTFEVDPAVDRTLRDGVLSLWADVSNAGGAVGFVPPVTPDEIRPALLKHLVAMTEGGTRLLVGRDGDGEVAATAFFTFNTHPLMTHWVWLYTVMVHPRHQGKGYGAALMAAVEETARTAAGFEAIEAIRLTCRGGTGVDGFYAKAGYKEVGRVPDAIRVAPGDDRDDIIMLLPLN